LTERSMQAQLLIPMANSLCFGLVFSTTLVLVLVPAFYLIYGTIMGRGGGVDGEDGPWFDERVRPRLMEQEQEVAASARPPRLVTHG